jgi:hypothetical protein
LVTKTALRLGHPGHTTSAHQTSVASSRLSRRRKAVRDRQLGHGLGR